MHDCFSFRFKRTDSEDRELLAIYCTHNFSYSSIIKHVKLSVNNNPVCFGIVILAHEISKDRIDSFLNDSASSNELKSLIGRPNFQPELVFFSSSGAITDSSTTADANLLERILKHGALAIFRHRKGLVKSSENYHFKKPSGDHCDKFIRASNLLVSGTEVAFLAISLLPNLSGVVKRIYVDSSSIAYVVSTAIQLAAKNFTEHPTIESFESYAVLNKPFDFVVDNSSLVVISASTSGSLAKKLVKKNNFPLGKIVTLFFANLPLDQLGLFDVSFELEGGINSFKEANCPMCILSRKIVNISGEQFLPEPPSHELLIIKKTDFKKERHQFVKEFSSKNFLKWRLSTSPHNEEHFFFDFINLLASKNANFEKKFVAELNKNLFRSMSKVVFIDDPASKALAEKIKQIYKDVEVFNAANLRQEESNISQWGSVLVVAGSITSGRSLLSVSRKLRGLSDQATIVYFVGVSKIHNKEISNQLRKDLELGGHKLVVLYNFNLPRIKPEVVKTSWDFEYDFLSSVSGDDPFAEKGEMPTLLSDRYAFLGDVTEFENQLFISKCDGSSLTLRPTFAFWHELEIKTEDATQADVYWTIQSIVHDLRCESSGKGLGGNYHSTMISPACFDRFNDGVIQACLLRSALPNELNYKIDHDTSRHMADIILSAIKNHNSDQGEAVLEFLMAIVTKRLSLFDAHLKEVADAGLQKDDESIVFLAKKIQALPAYIAV